MNFPSEIKRKTGRAECCDLFALQSTINRERKYTFLDKNNYFHFIYPILRTNCSYTSKKKNKNILNVSFLFFYAIIVSRNHRKSDGRKEERPIMRKKAVDQKITNALFELMEEKEYSEISITDIAARAGVSRVTYYRKFDSKEAIILRFFEMTKEKYMSTLSLNSNLPPEDNEVTILGLFLFFKSNMKANKCLRKAGLESELLKFLSNEFMQNLPIKLEKYTALFVAGALYNVLINWLDNDCKDPLEEVSKPFLTIKSMPQ